MTPSVERERIGSYQLEAELTASLSSFTYRAMHHVLPRQVIVKLAREPHDSLGVLREACILAALPHPGIVRVWETGRLADQRTWFASEIVDGDSLGNTLALGGALEASIAIGIVRDLAEILAHAHSRGVIHAGLTPDRIAITPRLRGFPLCITDWSTARTHDATSVHGWEPSAYTAPEMARGELDDRADVFALGAIAYRAFTGAAPDGGAPLAELAPMLPRQVALVVDQMLAYDRWDRPSSAEVRAALAMPEVPELRIRKPRWTPPLQFAPSELESSTPTIDDLEPPKRD
jgi:eukaryotic-like serine/threonine-protein kinase